MSLLNVLREYQGHSSADRIEGLRWHIQRNLSAGGPSRGRFRRFDRVQFLEAKTCFAEFGKRFSVLVAREDVHEAIELINSSHFRRVRDTTGEWRDRFSEIFGGEFYWCAECGVLECEDETRWAYEDTPICSACCDREFVWSDNRDTFVRPEDNEDYDECEDEDEDESIIREYHSTEIGRIPSSFDRRKVPILLGLELEVECSGDVSRESKAEELLAKIGRIDDHDYCGVERDGSLDHGFEIVTGYTGLDVHAKALEFFKTPWHGMKSHDTRTCGLHVHICKRGVSMLHAAKMIFFINESANQRLIRAIARRDSSDYAKIKNKKADFRWLKNAKQFNDPMRKLNEDRYEALNFQNEKTIEFRLFKGTLKYQTIMACLEFTYATWFFTRERGMNELTIDNFIEFICEPSNKADTANLRAYLKVKGFTLPKHAVSPRMVKVVQASEADLALAI